MSEEHGELDPRSAAELLEQTTAQARRQFDLRPPLLMLAGAMVVLVAYGAVWWSVRGQHPYSGPSGTALAVLYTTLVAWIIVVSVVFRRATRGVGGRSPRQQKADAVAFVPVWIAVYVFQGALHHAGASHAIVYGIYPAAAPLIIVGGAAAAHEAARENWHWVGFALAAVALAAAAAFTGPADVWAVIGIGLCVLLLVRAASQVWVRHA
ncbi:MAG TPA: hypothetical protein VIG35_01140 [Gaiellaceae bacterium]|jgi:hypothetical protein